MVNKKTFTSVNYAEYCGDSYSRWASNSKKDAVRLVVSDSSGKVVYSDIVRKGGMFTNTLCECMETLEARLRTTLKEAA